MSANEFADTDIVLVQICNVNLGAVHSDESRKLNFNIATQKTSPDFVNLVVNRYSCYLNLNLKLVVDVNGLSVMLTIYVVLVSH